MTSTDIMGLFHFAEHILFTDRIEFSGFESAETLDTSMRVVATLRSRGILDDGKDAPQVDVVDISPSDYAEACRLAAPLLASQLAVLPTEALVTMANNVTEASRPSGVTVTPVERWFSDIHWESAERERLYESALERKAIGSFDYTLSSSEALYKQVRDVGQRVPVHRDRLAMAIGVLFRSAINQKLASKRGTFYSPAPQRANLIAYSNLMFRQNLSKALADSLVPRVRHGEVAAMLNHLHRDEVLPLPVLAISLLRSANVTSPEEMLDAARVLRHEPTVVMLRSYLNGFEAAASAGDPEQLRQCHEELAKTVRQVESDLNSPSWRYSSRLSIALEPLLKRIDPEATLWLNPKLDDLLSDFGAASASIVAPVRLRRIFLATLAKEIVFDPKLGLDIYRMLGNRGLR